MNGNNSNNNLMCNQNQISKNLPLKKRRAYIIDSSTTNDNQNENFSKTIKQSYSQDDSFQINISPPFVVPTPPSSPHIELLRQQYAYLLANSINIQQQNYLQPSTYDCLMTQQFLDNYRALPQQCGYTIIDEKPKRTDITVDEHFRKSLGDNYYKFTDRCLTPDDSSSNSSPIERTPVDSIEEHFARSLGKFWPLNNTTSNEDKTLITESVVDDHFAKALGSTTWEKLKENHDYL